ncbi:MAG TPA: hypothetical protein VNE63_05925 [Candidatus Acidoferrales bacterium]|nr:hypothetical protein [Candidatus Acidoferrales bacterium]
MTADEYLSELLTSQALGDDSDELKALQTHRADVEKLIRDNFKNTALTIRYAGSKAKGTMNKEAYDLDIVSYVASGDNTAGETLENIYENHKKALGKKYIVEPKGSALRIKGCDPGNLGVDFHIDVVPGRFADDTKTDAYLYQSGGDKTRLKTNLDVHLDHVRNSDVIDAIRIAKLWRVRNGLPVRTFVLELAVIKLLKDQKKKSLSAQMEHFWTELRENSANLCIEDPANPNGNDLSKCLDDNLKSQLASAAKRTLEQIKSSGWEAVFGNVQKQQKAARIEILRGAAAVATPSRPWLPQA